FREGADPRGGSLLELDPLEQLVDAFVRVLAGQAAELRVHPQDLAGGERSRQVRKLGEVADAAPNGSVRGCAAEDGDRAARRTGGPDERLDGGRLAGAVWSDEAEHAALGDVEGHIVQDLYTAAKEADAEGLL